MHRIFLFCLLLPLPACGDKAKTPAAAPAKAETIAHEAELLRLTLTPQAVQRLGIATVKVGEGQAATMRETSGEIVVPNGSGGVPTGSLSNLAQIGAAQAAADGEVARTRAQTRLARIALDRATQLVAEEAGSVRARDEAAAAFATAQAQASVAVEQRRLLGPSVSSLGRQSTLWVRVSVSGTDIPNVGRSSSALVRPLGATDAGSSARPVQAPPSANAVAGTVDLYYAIDNRRQNWRVGQRVAVQLPTGRMTAGISVPASAILRDIYGGEWVYAQTAANHYVRQRVEIASTGTDGVIIARGLEPDMRVVTTGAMELFGTEFGVAH
ncbi:efflux RND transporter periplasmic adaptor subunit [Sphingobium sp. CR2-8]|uniref:efflux RND transporter periplasmic adaptor subunit n=1 Tax=Sphingobium sp. CR2-8 TaxID=1306534 RepID=UPI002DB7B24E|nr:efflux RND transporter periplasmic adaptor subunit [Sphingobium sp. CR2-8]MEC3909728.1 efflux RND transporter periplasmic adaptor subunit [Sphingobium sp. CR2-8]